MDEKTKKILWGAFAVVFVIVFAVWMIASPRPNHIEDTNGADNYALQTITEADVVANEMNSRGSVSKSEAHLSLEYFDISSGYRYSSRKFTGVQRLYACTIFKGSDVHVYLDDFRINSGNFAFYIVLDGEVVGEIKPSDDGISEFLLENIDKTSSLEYFIAGESADFEFITSEDW